MNSGLKGSKCRTLSLCLSKHRLLGPLAPTRTSLSVLLGTTSCHNTLPSQTCADEKQQPHVTGDVNADRLYTQLSHAPCRGKTMIPPLLHTRKSKHKENEQWPVRRPGWAGCGWGSSTASSDPGRAQTLDRVRGPSSLARPEPWLRTAHTVLLFSPFYAQHFPSMRLRTETNDKNSSDISTGF